MGGKCLRSQEQELKSQKTMFNRQISELQLIGPGRSSFLEPFNYDPKYEQEDFVMIGPGRQTYCEPLNFKFNNKLDELEKDITNLNQIFDQVEYSSRQNSPQQEYLTDSCKELHKKGIKALRSRVFKGILKSNESSFSLSHDSLKSVHFNPLKITRIYQKRSLRGLIL